MVGVKEALIQPTLTAAEMNLVNVGSLPEGEEVPFVGKIRYNDAGAEGTLEVTGQDEFKVHFPAGREAITPGQAVVCYDGEDVLARGWLRKVSLESDDLLL